MQAQQPQRSSRRLSDSVWLPVAAPLESSRNVRDWDSRLSIRIEAQLLSSTGYRFRLSCYSGGVVVAVKSTRGRAYTEDLLDLYDFGLVLMNVGGTNGDMTQRIQDNNSPTEYYYHFSQYLSQSVIGVDLFVTRKRLKRRHPNDEIVGLTLVFPRRNLSRKVFLYVDKEEVARFGTEIVNWARSHT